MNLTFKELLCPNCNVLMRGHGGQYGGLTHVKMKCYACDLVLIILPMEDDTRYDIQATPKLAVNKTNNQQP